MGTQQTWPQIVDEVKPKFNQIAEQSKLVLWATESQFAIQAIQQNKKLAATVPYTVQNAVINVAAVGLTLNPADGYAYLVPTYNTQTKQNEAQLRVSFKGLIKIANDSGAIKWVKADVVKKNDTFTYKGVNELPNHEMNPFGDRGATIGVYCIAKTHDGEYLTDIITKSEIDQIRGCAKTDMVWAQWYDEMAKKAVIKRAAKQWPKSPTGGSENLHAAIEVINESEGSDPAYLKYSPEHKEKFDDLVFSSDGFGILCLRREVGDNIYNDLYNSGEKGKKVALKDAVKALESEGHETLTLMVNAAKDSIESDDDAGLLETIEEAGDIGKRLIWVQLSPEEQTKAKDMIHGESK